MEDLLCLLVSSQWFRPMCGASFLHSFFLMDLRAQTVSRKLPYCHLRANMTHRGVSYLELAPTFSKEESAHHRIQIFSIFQYIKIVRPISLVFPDGMARTLHTEVGRNEQQYTQP
jgi:hypothetical protein